MLVVPLPGLAGRIPRLSSTAYPAPFVALLDPFLATLDSGTLNELKRLFADVVPFPTEIIGVSEFPGGATYLAPHPTKPYRHLVHAVERRFPEAAGHHPSVFTDSPHVRLSPRPGETLQELQQEIEPWLPAGVLASEAALWHQDDDEDATSTSVVAVFPFGTSAA